MKNAVEVISTPALFIAFTFGNHYAWVLTVRWYPATCIHSSWSPMTLGDLVLHSQDEDSQSRVQSSRASALLMTPTLAAGKSSGEAQGREVLCSSTVVVL
jgi:hypothetical protein